MTLVSILLTEKEDNMQDIQKLFEDASSRGLFTDFDVCVRGAYTCDFSGGLYVSSGAKLFDISSLTKALVNLLIWKMFSEKALSPDDRFDYFLPLPGIGGRELWHFMSYLVQEYAFDFKQLRSGENSRFKRTLLLHGFGNWNKMFCYDNFASAYMGLMLEHYFGTGIESILCHQLLPHAYEHEKLMFHPVRRGSVSPSFVVPARVDLSLRGLVHDPLSFSHQGEDIVAAGMFSTARTLADLFHNHIDKIITSGFYDIGSQNQLQKVGIPEVQHDYALGFDRPWPESLAGVSVDSPLMFAGYTGCRIFFCKQPRLTLAILTNRVFSGDTLESRASFSQFFWKVVKEVLCFS